MTNDLNRSVSDLFERHSIPVTLEEVQGVTARPIPRSRVSGPLVAAAVFVLVVSVGALGLLLPRGTRTDATVVSSAPTTMSEPSATTAPTPTTDAVPRYPTEPLTLLSEPEVVQQVPLAPPPQFDTSGLGTEVPLVPFTDLTIEDLALVHNEFPLRSDTPIVALGQLSDLAAFRLTVDAFDAPHACDWGVGINDLAMQTGQPAPLGECAFNQAPRPDLTVRLRNYGSDTGSGSPWVSQVFWSGLSDNASVVAISANGDEVKQWQRPIGGVAVFVVTADTEPDLVLVSYDENGQELATTMAGQVSSVPIDGQPEAIGVTSVEFVAAVFPTTPEEVRVTAAWDAIRYNVEASWTEQCMSEAGFVLDIPRVTASMTRRRSEMPDFQLDAQLGFDLFIDEASLIEPGPLAGASEAERVAWETTYQGCSLETERRRSEGFDQVLGRTPAWWDIVSDVNNSEEMAQATSQMLSCVAEGGGPVANSIEDLYGGIDVLLRNAETAEEFDSIAASMPDLIAGCAGTYDSTKQELLVPERHRLLRDYASELAEAEEYFDSVLARAGFGS